MILNLTEVLTAEGRTETKQVDFTPSVLEYGGQHYTITEKSPVTLTIANQGKGRAWLTGEMKLTALLSCDRCLKDVSYPCSLEFSCRVISPELEAAVSEDEDECLRGYQVDVDDLVYNEISVNWPMKILCRPDCKGICKVCGKDLNEGACECDTFIPDPRLAVIKDIFNAGKEV